MILWNGGLQIQSGMCIVAQSGTLAKGTIYIYNMSRESDRPQITAQKKGTFATKVRGVSRETPLFSWCFHRYSPLFRKVLILGSTYTFQPKILSFLLAEPLTFDKKISFPLANHFLFDRS